MRVAVVGGGISGASTAYFLKKFLPDGNEPHTIDVFEARDYIGGRLKAVDFFNRTINVGGDAWASANEYISNVAKELNITYDNGGFGGNNLTGTWDGHRFYHNAAPLESKVILGATIDYFVLSLRLNYHERAIGTFSTIPQFLAPGALNSYVGESSSEYVSRWKLNKTFVSEDWEPITRTIYDQPLSLNLFAGLVSLLPGVEESFSVLGGNQVIVERMLEESNANVHLNSPVIGVHQCNDGTFNVSVKQHQSTSIGSSYDRVVLAAPFEYLNLSLTGVQAPVLPNPRKYHHWYVILAAAKDGLNPSAFGNTSPVPDTIFTMQNSTTKWTVLTIVDRSPSGILLYKLFSNQPLSENELESMFIGYVGSYTQHWPYTFPDLSPPKSFQPVLLNPEGSLIYTAGMESVAVAMEVGVIAGRNAALIIANGDIHQ